MPRHQLNILRRRAAVRLRLSKVDWLVFVWLYRLCPAMVDAVEIIQPETLIRWHHQYAAGKYEVAVESRRIDATYRTGSRRILDFFPLWLTFGGC